ncbi:unnamed protein product [Arabidopsis halleri]
MIKHAYWLKICPYIITFLKTTHLNQADAKNILIGEEKYIMIPIIIYF